MTTSSSSNRSTGSGYVHSAIDGELLKLRNPDTKDANSTLFMVAARLFGFVEADAVPEEYIYSTLQDEASKLKLTTREIKDTLKSARKADAHGPPAALPPAPFFDAEGQPCCPHHHTRLLPCQNGNGYRCETWKCFWWDGAGQSFGGTAVEREPVPPEEVETPPDTWQAAGQAFLEHSQDMFWNPAYPQALDYLEPERKLNLITAQSGRFGFNPRGLERSRARWGLPEDDEHGDRLFLWPGLVMPYYVDGRICKIEIRQLGKGQKPKTLPGSANVPWGIDHIRSTKTIMLVEGVLNGLTIKQEAGDLVTPVALGSATAARRIRWIAALARAQRVLVSLDAGHAGESAATYWLDVLQHTARRWRPYTDDPNAMLQAGMDVRAWVKTGLEVA